MKTKQTILVVLALLVSTIAFSQVGIGTPTPNAKSILELDVTSLPADGKKGFLPPRLTTDQRDLISSPAEGLTIFNTTVGCLQWFNGTAWFDACEGGLITPGPVSDCPFIPPFLTAAQTVVKDVESAGETWMDRNLGAYTADRSTPSAAGGTDCWAYGNLYQWGRASEGHEYRSSGTTATNATTAVPNTGKAWDGLFITEPSSPWDWLTPQNDNLWQGVSGTNNPCPSGYRLPTETELNTERLSWGGVNQNSLGAITSPLKLPVSGNRTRSTGGLNNVGSSGSYWSSTVSGAAARYLFFLSTDAYMYTGSRATGRSVRCLKD